MTESLLESPDLVLCGLSMVPVSFQILVDSAARAGFDAISVGSAVYRRAVKDGLTMVDMRRILDESGVWVSEIEGVGNWLTPADDKPARWAQPVSDEELLELAEALAARTLLVTHFGSPVPAEEAGLRFAGLCDRVAPFGLDVGLEFVAFATINDLRTASEIVRVAGRSNGGLVFDTWHYFRGGPDGDALKSLDAGSVVSVQLADADAIPVGALEEDILRRRMPGEGSLDLRSVVTKLGDLGVRAPIGIEVWDKDLLDGGREAAAQVLHDRMVSFISAVLDDPAGG